MNWAKYHGGVKKCEKKSFGGYFGDLKARKDYPWCQETLSGLQGGDRLK